MAGLKDKPITNAAALYAGLLQAVALYLVYLSISLTDIWGYMPPPLQLVVYGILAIGMMMVILHGLLMKSPWGLRVSLKAAFLSVVLLSIAGILAGTDSTRLLELAVKPRMIFTYPVPEIMLTVSPPAHMEGTEVTTRMSLSEGLKPMAEGSQISIDVKNISFAPTLIVGQRQVGFSAAEGGGFVAQFTLKEEIVWQIKEGRRVIGHWPITIVADDAPVIERLDYRKILTDDGLFALSLHLYDDYGLHEVAVGVVPPNGDADDVQDRTLLEISGLKEFSGEIYVNLAVSELAGNKADLIVEVTDQAGQKQRKTLAGITLPAREFSNPLSRDITDIRQRIVSEPQNRKKLARRLMSKGLVPDYGRTPVIYYVVLRSAYWRLIRSEDEGDIKNVTDILWDLANQMEDGSRGEFSRDILARLAVLKLTLYKGQDMDRIRKELQEIDEVIILFLRAQTGLQDLEKFDVKELRRIYGKILTFSHYKKFDQAIDLISYLEQGFIYQDKYILSEDGFRRFQIVARARNAVGILKKTQRQIMSYVYKSSVELELVSLDLKTVGKLKTAVNGDIHKWIALQQKLGTSLEDLAQSLTKLRANTDQVTGAITDLMRDVTHSMEAGDMEAAAQYQSEILTLFKRLENILDEEMKYSSE